MASPWENMPPSASTNHSPGLGEQCRHEASTGGKPSTPACRHLSQPLKGVSVEQFYKGINKVAPSLIRTEADEVSYHFHVMIRYELEKACWTAPWQ
jgi:hypothetical protein